MRDLRPGKAGPPARHGVRKGASVIGGEVRTRGAQHQRNLRLVRQYEANPNPPMKRPGLGTVAHGVQHGVQAGLETAGLGGAAHPIRRAQHIREGGPMALPLGGPSSSFLEGRLARTILPRVSRPSGSILKSGKSDWPYLAGGYAALRVTGHGRLPTGHSRDTGFIPRQQPRRPRPSRWPSQR